MVYRTLPRTLRAELVLLGLLYLIAIGAAGLLWLAAPAERLRYLAVAGAVGGTHLLLALRHAPENHAEADIALWPTVGFANWLTLLRGILITLVAGFIAVPGVAAAGWAVALLYTAAALIDILDGLVARLTRRQTVFGAQIDMAYDALGLLTVIAVGIALGNLPIWFILVGLARYLYVALLTRDQQHGRSLRPLSPSRNRRIAASTMMGFLAVMLWPTIGRPHTILAAWLFGAFFLSGFARDYLVVSSRLDTDNPTYLRLRAVYKRVGAGWLPPALRLLALALWASGQVSFGGTSAVGIIGLLGLALAVPGIVGRLGGLLLLVPAIFGGGAPGALLLLLACGIGVALLGSGRFALWQPEETFWDRREADAS